MNSTKRALTAGLTTWERFKATPDESMGHVCTAMSEGESVISIARMLGIDNWTLHQWIHAEPERARLYAAALEVRAACWADKIERAAEEPVRRNSRGDLDPADVALKRLRVDALKWTAAKLSPKRYGDKVEVEASVTHDVVGELRSFLMGTRLPIRAADAIESDAGGNPLVRAAKSV